jgi:hypothetical protein
VPFLLGPVEGPSWLVLQPGAAGGLVTVPLTQASPGPEPASAGGEHLADYVLEYEDGSERRWPTRRRFEVDEALIMWGQ